MQPFDGVGSHGEPVAAHDQPYLRKRSKKPAPICWATHPATTANEPGTRRVSYLMRPSAA